MAKKERQTYQKVARVILEELMRNPVDFRKENPHIYFYNLKMKHPEKYERLTFDTNGYEPYCKDLSRIFMDYKVCAFMDSDNNIFLRNKERIVKYLNEHGIILQQ